MQTRDIPRQVARPARDLLPRSSLVFDYFPPSLVFFTSEWHLALILCILIRNDGKSVATCQKRGLA
jgi:hypothetical protein